MRTILIRSLQALVSISAVALLTGANDPGCIPSSDGGTAGGTTGTSSGGTAGGSTGTGMACPDGSVAQWVCGDPGTQPPPPMGSSTGSPMQPPPMGSGSANPGQPPPPMGSSTGSPMQPPPPMGDAGVGCPPPPPPCDPTTGAMCPPAPGCVLQCVPMGDVCPTGFHQETVCSDPPPPPPAMDAGTPVPPAPSMGPGAAGTMGDPSTGNCTTACVPDDACPPGTVQVTVCSGGGAPSDPMDPNTPPPGDQMCWNECQPADPSQPPPQMP